MEQKSDDKLHLLMEYAGYPEAEVADPWYTGDFEVTWRDAKGFWPFCRRTGADHVWKAKKADVSVVQQGGENPGDPFQRLHW